MKDTPKGEINYLDERTMSAFLDDQMKEEGQPVLNYAFVTANQKRVISAIGWGYGGPYGHLEPACEYVEIEPQIIGVPENYLDVVYTDNYKPVDY